MKHMICTVTGLTGSIIASLFGGFDAGLVSLLIFMLIDYISGLVVAGVFKKSPKTKSGALESRAGLKGLCRKCMILLCVLVGHRLDIVTGATYIKDAIVIAFMANELISIIENLGLMGINLPTVLIKAVDILQNTADNK